MKMMVEAIARVVRTFRKATAPLDWLEFGVFVLVAMGVGVLIIVAFSTALIDATKERDGMKVATSLAPLLLLAWAVIRSVMLKKVHWILVVFAVLVSAVAFYLIYF